MKNCLYLYPAMMKVIDESLSIKNGSALELLEAESNRVKVGTKVDCRLYVSTVTCLSLLFIMIEMEFYESLFIS